MAPPLRGWISRNKQDPGNEIKPEWNFQGINEIQSAYKGGDKRASSSFRITRETRAQTRKKRRKKILSLLPGPLWTFLSRFFARGWPVFVSHFGECLIWDSDGKLVISTDDERSTRWLKRYFFLSTAKMVLFFFFLFLLVFDLWRLGGPWSLLWFRFDVFWFEEEAFGVRKNRYERWDFGITLGLKNVIYKVYRPTFSKIN